MLERFDLKKKRPWRRSLGNGFSLIELVIALSIIAILAAMAYPSYTQYVRKAARKEAVGKVLEIASRLEQFKTQKMAYPSGAQLDPFAFTGAKYSFVVEAITEGVAVKATPIAGSAQEQDECGVITYQTPGTWAFSGSGMTEKECL